MEKKNFVTIGRTAFNDRRYYKNETVDTSFLIEEIEEPIKWKQSTVVIMQIIARGLWENL